MSVIIFLILLILNIPIYTKLFGLFFEDTDEFYEAVKYSFIPDLFSFFKGEYSKDFFLSFKLSFFFFTSFGLVGLEYLVISKLFL